MKNMKVMIVALMFTSFSFVACSNGSSKTDTTDTATKVTDPAPDNNNATNPSLDDPAFKNADTLKSKDTLQH